MTVRAYVALGANLDSPVKHIRSALRELGGLPGTCCRRVSALYRNPALGPPGQSDYVNAVAEVDTRLGASELLGCLLAVEDRHGRLRAQRWGPRTLDLDLLLFGSLRLQTRRLTLPHPRLQLRAFVVCPLAELAPTLVIPGRGSLALWRARCSTMGLRRVVDG